MPEKHSRAVPGRRAFWWTEHLWGDGRTVVDAVRFDADPEPDWVEQG